MITTADIRGKNLAMIVVDMQNKFTQGPLREPALAMLPTINKTAQLFRDEGRPVVFIKMDGEGHGPYIGPGEADEFIDGLDIREDERVFHKSEMNAFFNTGLGEYLNSLGVDGAIVCGLVAKACVIATYFGAYDFSICPYILEGGTASTDPIDVERVYGICKTVNISDIRLNKDFEPVEGYVSDKLFMSPFPSRFNYPRRDYHPMKISEAYRLAIEMGMSKDPRPKDEVQKVLDMAKAEYDRITDSERELFDVESLWNPYWDCRFSYGEDADAECIMWGIDIGTGEMLLADRLREKGKRIDAVCAHHPNGASRIPFPKVMDMQSDMFHNFGVPINVAEDLMRPRTDEVMRSVMGSNYNQAVDAARLLGIPFFNIHSAADNMCQAFLQDLMDKNEPKRLGDVLDLLMAEPEYRIAAKSNCRPKVMVGSKDSRCGRILCKMTGGTSLPKTMYKPLADAGVGTVMAMHFPSDHYEAAREAHINLVCSEHMPSDSLGVNQICDEWERRGIDVLPCSGLIRCSRI